MAEQRRNSRNTKSTKVQPVNDYGRIQPQAPELEEAVLGALMIEKDAYSLVSEILRPESFYEHRHQLISLPTTISNGKQIEIAHRWNNFGWGYCPTNIPQWKNKYKVAFALLDTKNDKPKYVFVDGEPEACDWVKGTAKSYTFTTRVEGVEAGKYMWAVGIVDTAKQNEIGIHLAVKNNVTSAGWLKLFEVTAR